MSVNNGVYFNGRWITHPGAYGTIDAKGMTSMNSTSKKIVALIGTSTGGIPGTVMWFNNPTSAKKVLKGGYLLKAAQKAWQPTSDGKGAYTIACIRVNQAIQASLNVSDSIPTVSSIGDVIKTETNTSTGVVKPSGIYTGAKDRVIQIIIESADSSDLSKVSFGWRYDDEDWKAQNTPIAIDGKTPITLADGIQVTFGNGTYTKNSVWKINVISAKNSTVGGTIVSKDYGVWNNKLQCKLEDGSHQGTKMLTTHYYEDSSYEVLDNIGACFYLRYTGVQNYASVTVKRNLAGKAINLTTKIGVDEASAIVDLNIDLTDPKISNLRVLVDYISQYENYDCRIYPIASSELKATDLDALSNVSIKTDTMLCALWKDIEIQLNNNSNYVNFVSKSIVAGIPNNFEYTNLANGSDGATPASWLSYFDLLSTYDINYIVPLTGDESIIAEATENVKFLSDSMGRERTLKVGGYTGEAVKQVQGRALSYNSDRVQVAYPGFYDMNEKGEQELYPSFITAAMYAGRDAYLDVGDSATFNYFNVAGLEKDLNPTDIDALIKAGVATLEHVVNKGFRLVQDITSYTDDTISLYCERSVRDLADSLNKELRVKIEEEIIGNKGIVTNVQSVKNLTIGFLQQKIKDNEIVAYKNVSVVYANRVINIEYGAAPVEPTNFAFISGHFYTAEDITA